MKIGGSPAQLSGLVRTLFYSIVCLQSTTLLLSSASLTHFFVGWVDRQIVNIRDDLAYEAMRVPQNHPAPPDGPHPVATGFEHILKADVHPLAHQNNSE